MKTSKVRVADAPEHERFTAALSYVWVLSLYPLLFRKDSTFIQFHAKQGVVLFAIEVLSFVTLFFAPLVILICIVASIWGIRSALAGKYWSIPILGDWIKRSKL